MRNPSETHVVMYSGGVASWATAKRVAEENPRSDIVLLFADTKIEDPDLYRFLDESAALLPAKLVKISEGRTPWEVFNDVKLIGNTRADPCSRILKRDLMRRWLEENCTPAETTVHIGFTWDEFHRWERAKKHWSPWPVDAPMTRPPYLLRHEILNQLSKDGVEPPLLTRMGFPHNNCGGFCIKAGQAQFAKLLREFPERYAEHERSEADWNSRHGKSHAILRDRRGGDTVPMTLTQFRERLEAGGTCDQFDWGGCACLEPPEKENHDAKPECAT